MVSCLMCSRPLRLKLLGNHLLNKHQVEQDQLELVANWHLNKKCIKLAKEVKMGAKKIKMKNCHKKPIKRSKLKKRFDDAMRGEHFGVDGFSKLLMDVSRDYHTSNINRKNEKTGNSFRKADDYKGDLKFKINLSSQKMEKSFSDDTSRLLDESPDGDEEKGSLTTTLSESVFLPNQNSTSLKDSEDVSLAKKTNVSKLKARKATRMKTSTQRQKKKSVKNQKNTQE